MTNLTIGVGGDFATLEAALLSLNMADLADDYTFDIISNLTANANSTHLLYLNGHTVHITCSYNASPQNWQP